MQVNGEAKTLFEAIGHKRGEAQPALILDVLGTQFETETSPAGDRTYWVFKSMGTDVTWEENVLTCINLRIQKVLEEPSYAEFPKGATIFPELPEWPTRDQIEQTYGTPEISRGGFIGYHLGARVVRFAFDDEDRLAEISFVEDSLFR